MRVASFPMIRLRFAESNDLTQQMEHLRSEIDEVAAELECNEIRVENLAREVADVMISAHTMLCIIERVYGIHPLDVLLRVHHHNRTRGYEA